MANKIIRVVSLASDGSTRSRDFDSFDEIEKAHEQVGIDDCSTDLTLRGMPVFRGLIGPIPESRAVVRYETPDVFEAMTKEWAAKKRKRRRRRTAEEIARDNAALAAAEAAKASGKVVPMPNIAIGSSTATPSTPIAD